MTGSDEVRYLRGVIAAQRADIERLNDRMAVIESLVFQLGPGSLAENIDSIEAVRGFLKKIDISALTPHVTVFLAERLTVDWRDLIKRKGVGPVFQALRDGRSIVEARRLA